MKYAEKTTVSVSSSKIEIERILARYGATGFMYGIKNDTAMIAFEAHNRHVRFILPLPNISDKEFRHTPSGRDRNEKNIEDAYNQEVKRRWRTLALAIKAKLEVVETGIAEFEEEFMANIVMPNGQTISDSILPAIEEAYSTKKMVSLLPCYD